MERGAAALAPAFDGPTLSFCAPPQARVRIDDARVADAGEHGGVGDAVGVEAALGEVDVVLSGPSLGDVNFAGAVAEAVVGPGEATILNFERGAEHVRDIQVASQRVGGVGGRGGEDSDDIAAGAATLDLGAGVFAHARAHITCVPSGEVAAKCVLGGALKRAKRATDDFGGVDDAEMVLRDPPAETKEIAGPRFAAGIAPAHVEHARVGADESAVHIEDCGGQIPSSHPRTSISEYILLSACITVAAPTPPRHARSQPKSNPGKNTARRAG